MISYILMIMGNMSLLNLLAKYPIISRLIHRFR